MHKKQTAFWWILLLLVMVYPIFGVLDKMPIRLWDESRNAMNAIEMSQNHQWFVTYFEGAPDMWNTKPPLLIWLQVFFIKLIGIHPLAIRLPVAIATAVLCIFLFKNLSRISKDYLFGFIAIMILLSSVGFVSEHVTRTGDYDGLLVCFSTLSAFCFYKYLEAYKSKHFWIFIILAAMAVWTKGVAGMLVFPALLLYALYRKAVLNLIKRKEFYAGIVVFLSLVAVVYLGREMNNPGYLAKVAENELGGRFLNTLENHNYPFSHYWENIVDGRWAFWLVSFALGIPIIFTTANQQLKRLGTFCLLLSVTLFLIISSSQTKLVWYDAMLYPYLSVVAAFAVYAIVNLTLQKTTGVYKPICTALLLVGVFYAPFMEVCQTANAGFTKKEDEHLYQFSYYLKALAKERLLPYGAIIVTDDYMPHALFYMYMANDNGANVHKKHIHEVQKGDVVLVRNEATKQVLLAQHQLEILSERNGFYQYLVK